MKKYRIRKLNEELWVIETFSPTILDYITVGEWSTEINALKDLIKWLEMDNEKLESQLQPNIRNPNNS